ncbi:hypothetical protein [Psychromonas hadalis]|uniref:hypothetical protein n=1 Tax=Psychromonas hadalis TaxID=211669 RepID=UPI0012EB6DE9|nr:hypothetical protein [Psychromonas hadalis]
MFSLLHGVIAPQDGQLTILPASIDVSNEDVSPNEIGDGNHVSQPDFKHLISISLICDIYIFPIFVVTIMISVIANR